jgi:hypothetical protein
MGSAADTPLRAADFSGRVRTELRRDYPQVDATLRAPDVTLERASDAETQATRWIQEQPPSWRARIRTILIANRSRGSDKKGFGPCDACCTDLALFLTGLKALPGSRGVQAAGIFWLELYDRCAACGHPTDRANLDRLTAAGWTLGGPRPAQRELSLTGR